MPTYTFQWQCRYCGQRTSRKVTSNPHPPTPQIPGKCPSNPSGKHVVERIE